MPRLARTTDGTAVVGDRDGFVPLSSAEPELTDVPDALRRATADPPDPSRATAEPVPADHLDFALPLPEPGKLWGIGLNYVEHADDLDAEHPDQPASFLKPTTAATGPGGPIRLPPADASEHVTAEAELGVVIGRTCKRVDAANAGDVIAGYVPILDVTAEDVLQRNPRFLTRAKSFDSFLVAGPWIRTTAAVEPLDDVVVRTVIEDSVVAENRVSNMRFSPHELVAYHSDVMTLEPGDVISTGTPGAGRIEPGDAVRAEVDAVGTLAAEVVR